MPIEIEIFIQLLVLIHLSLPILALSSQSQGIYLHLDSGMLFQARKCLNLSQACSVDRLCFSFSGVNGFSQAPNLINGLEPLYLYCCSPPDSTFIPFFLQVRAVKRSSSSFLMKGVLVGYPELGSFLERDVRHIQISQVQFPDFGCKNGRMSPNLKKEAAQFQVTLCGKIF